MWGVKGRFTIATNDLDHRFLKKKSLVKEMRGSPTSFDIWSVQIELIVSERVRQWMRKWCVVKYGCKNGYLEDMC